MKFSPILVLPGLLWGQVPTARELSRQVIANELRQVRELPEFTFEYEVRLRKYAGKGDTFREVVETGESYRSSRRNIDIPLTRNGTPLKPKDLEKARKTAIAKMEADGKLRKRTDSTEEAPLERPGPGMQRRETRMSAVDVLRYCSLGDPYREGEYFEVEFDRCQSPWPGESHYPHLRGVMRVEAETMLLDSWKAWITDGPKGGELFFEQTTQEAVGGIRVLSLNRMNKGAAPHLFPKDREDVTYRWLNPKRFVVEVNQTIEEPK
ncbi:MAG: hypothetical protein FJW20_11675 [Acidimicrobiia bacterium]|nr:hypothetical protein [Acidimicrobiia bacterium]